MGTTFPAQIFAIDIDGCIMPPGRTKADLNKLQKLEKYCNQARQSTLLPQIVIFTGRSQEYVEFLSQIVGLLDCPFELPFVIENGTAIYFPTDKRTQSIIPLAKVKKITQARELLMSQLPDHPFEPKQYIITLNPVTDEPIDDLGQKVKQLLQRHNIFDDFTVTSSASSIDILPRGIDKLHGLKYIMQHYLSKQTHVIAMGDSLSDLSLMQHASKAYVPQNAHTQVKEAIVNHYGRQALLSEYDIDAVLKMIQLETQHSVVLLQYQDQL